MKRCYLGELDRDQVEDEWEALIDEEDRRHFIFKKRSTFYVSYTGKNHRCILRADPHPCDTLDEALEYSQIRVNRGSTPLDRGESVTLRPIAVWNRQKAVYAWMTCAQKLGLLKDLARLIGEYVFKTELKEWI